MEDLEELGIPGHASKKPSMHRLQTMLRELGLSFEAEGDTIRIHFEGITIELNDYNENIQVQIEITPDPNTLPEEAAKNFYLFGLATALIRAEEYGIENLSGYTILWAARNLDTLEDAVELIEKTIRKLIEHAKTSIKETP